MGNNNSLLPQGITIITENDIIKGYIDNRKKQTPFKLLLVNTQASQIGKRAFQNQPNITYLNFNPLLSNIGDYAFKDCINLVTVELIYGNVGGMFVLGEGVFQGCKKLLNVTFYKSLNINEIKKYTFKDCISLKKIVLPNYIKNIDEFAFNNCSSLNDIIIPNTVTSINRGVFEDCSSLKNITLSNSLKIINTATFKKCRNLTSIIIPDSITVIGYSAFEDCTSLKNITLSNSLILMNLASFKNCSSLTSIIIPESVTQIENETFQNCSNLTNITFKGKLPFINDNSFLNIVINIYHYNWSDADIDNLKQKYTNFNIIKLFTINNSVLTEYNGIDRIITIPSNVSIIGDNMKFKNKDIIKEIILPNNLKVIGKESFRDLGNLTSITIPDSVTQIKRYAFNGCSSLKQIKISNSLKLIEYNVFTGCDLTSVIIPYSVTEIQSYAFFNNYNLTEITFTDKKPIISYSAFQTSFYNLTSDIRPVTIYHYHWTVSEINALKNDLKTSYNRFKFIDLARPANNRAEHFTNDRNNYINYILIVIVLLIIYLLYINSKLKS
jgi:hypothetical protein